MQPVLKSRAPRRRERPRPSPVVALVSLGCAKNLVDSENLLGDLYARNFRLESDPLEADAVIINTCGFIGPAVEETRRTIAEFIEHKRRGRVERVYAMGCYVSRGAEDLLASFPGLDGAYSLKEVPKLLADVAEVYHDRPVTGRLLPAGIRPVSATLPHTSYLKISEGCSRTCTYCIIPAIRGPNEDKSIEELVEEARRLAARGVKELSLIAQDTTAYGIARYGRPRLLDLLRELEKVEGLEWLRLLYAYPDHFPDELADFLVESPKMVKYLELPIQHAAPSVLRRMHRPRTRELYDRLFDRLRARRPDFCLRTTAIVGFPGESEEEFAELLDYCATRRFDRLAAFRYCREEGTPAARLRDQVPAATAEERHHRIMTRQQELHLEANQRLVGHDMAFIADTVSAGGLKASGRTWRDAPEIDARIEVTASFALRPGTIATCRVSGMKDYDLLGVL